MAGCEASPPPWSSAVARRPVAACPGHEGQFRSFIYRRRSAISALRAPARWEVPRLSRNRPCVPPSPCAHPEGHRPPVRCRAIPRARWRETPACRERRGSNAESPLDNRPTGPPCLVVHATLRRAHGGVLMEVLAAGARYRHSRAVGVTEADLSDHRADSAFCRPPRTWRRSGQQTAEGRSGIASGPRRSHRPCGTGRQPRGGAKSSRLNLGYCR
jgi:hypothetical protein